MVGVQIVVQWLQGLPRVPASRDILYQMPTEDAIDLTLRYEGPDVDSGSMAIEDVVTALQGFGGAYSKLARAHCGFSRLRAVGPGPATQNTGNSL
jgi:hypothetical protein